LFSSSLCFYSITTPQRPLVSIIGTTPSEIIPYYRLNHSIWSLSNNKESSCWGLPGLRPVNHLKHTKRIEHMH
jgi:hypothetical protein